MLYPVYVHQQEDSAFGAIVPDLPGVHSAADQLEELPAMIQEAVELMYDGEEKTPPPASAVTAYLAQPQYQDGFWMFVDVDLTKVNTRAVRLNISLPEHLVGKIDKAAAARRMSRSAFLAMAAEHELSIKPNA
ncbi:type II toxin-antitoxin system HicB family antitoxin [Stenotrophomonas sp.]|uniref:type II toxin-antitoxin system HicB family antitoxin n=1 Tax=Stenotrophomonas sp. TaxID=69392 RepID=UPI0028AAE9F5|nr:type II toxin-antitoxin system HicB family antitoxin [Stenotrophomonas sp.]